MRGYFYKEKNGDYTVFDYDNPQPVQTVAGAAIAYAIISIIVFGMVFLCHILDYFDILI